MNKVCKNIKRILALSFFVSILIIVGIFFVTESTLASINVLCLWVLGFIYVWILTCFIMYNYKINFTIYGWKHCYLIFVVGAVALLFILPFKYEKIIRENFVLRELNKYEQVEVINLETKNDVSHGFEVCIESIKKNNQDFNVYELPMVGSWEFLKDKPFISGGDSESLIISGNDISIVFRKSNKSGIVRVEFGPYSKEYDLYTNEEVGLEMVDSKKLIETAFVANKNWGLKLVFYILQFLVIFEIILAIGYLQSMREKKK